MTKGLTFPVEGESVTGHKAVVYAQSEKSGRLIGELYTRSGHSWVATSWDAFTGNPQTGYTSRSLDLTSIGLPGTETNNQLIEDYAQKRAVKKAEAKAHLALVPSGEDQEDDEGDED